MNIFEGRKLAIATKHNKELVINNHIELALGVTCFTPDNLDTDILGTFSGEVERASDPVSTARAKCHMAMELSGCDMAIASEGSFGAHPYMFFAHANEEILLFTDKKYDLEIVVREVSLDTNFSGEDIVTKEQLINFAAKTKFPSHGLIIRKAKDENVDIVKGITDWVFLVDTFKQHLNKYGTVYVETDMRAMYNPTRMAVIEKAALKLADKIKALCPECETPGFGVTEAKPGLPCQVCGFRTRSILSHLYICKKCSYTSESMYPNNKTTEDPMYCDNCNP
jgi:hypothetical protein